MPQVKHAASGKCLQLDDTFLHLWDCEADDATQLFGFARFEEGVRIFVKATGMCLDLETDYDQHGWNIFKQRRCADVPDQKFRVGEWP